MYYFFFQFPFLFYKRKNKMYCYWRERKSIKIKSKVNTKWCSKIYLKESSTYLCMQWTQQQKPATATNQSMSYIHWELNKRETNYKHYYFPVTKHCNRWITCNKQRFPFFSPFSAKQTTEKRDRKCTLIEEEKLS